MIKSVIQEELTGCAIASTAVLAGTTYKEAKSVANDLGIYAEDKALWSETDYIRRLLLSFNIETDKNKTTFTGWDQLPNRALLAINWHLESPIGIGLFLREKMVKTKFLIRVQG